MYKTVQICQLDVGNEKNGGVKDNDNVSSTNDYVKDGTLTKLAKNTNSRIFMREKIMTGFWHIEFEVTEEFHIKMGRKGIQL